MRTPSTARFARRTGAGLLRGVNRLVQVAIVVALSLGVRRRDPSVIVNGVVSAAFASTPTVLERRYGARIRPGQRLWVSTAALVHTLGMLGPYDRVWWWDHAAHTLSGVVVGAAADVFLRAEGASRSPVAGRHRSAFVVGVTLGFGLLWELLEYVVHTLGDRLGFEPLLVHYGRLDTLGDLAYDVVGAGLVVLFGRRALANVVDSVVDDGAGDHRESGTVTRRLSDGDR